MYRPFCFALLIAGLVIGVPRTHADTMYTYTGGPFQVVTGAYTTADRITGSFIVADGFLPTPGAGPDDLRPGVVWYHFTDGHQMLTQGNSTAVLRWEPRPDYVFGPHWDLSLWNARGRLSSLQEIGYTDAASSLHGSGFHYANGVAPTEWISTRGTWEVHRVPEASSLVLVLVSAVVSALLWRACGVAKCSGS